MRSKECINRSDAFYTMSFTYILASALISAVINLPEFIRSILALPIFYLFPVLLGWVVEDAFIDIYQSFKNGSKRKSISFNQFTEQIIFQLVLGIYVSIFLLTILQMAHFFILIKLFYIMALSIVALKITLRLKVLFKHNASLHSLLRWPFGSRRDIIFNIIGGIIICVFSSLTFVLKMTYVPFPLTTWSSWTLPIVIVQPAIRLMQNGFFDLSLSRPPEFLFTAVACQLLHVDPMAFLWTGTFLLTIFFATGVFCFVYELTQKDFITSILAGILSIF